MAKMSEYLTETLRTLGPENPADGAPLEGEEKWKDYEERLKKMDWWYMMSDDHRVWSGGEVSMGKLKKLKAEMDAIDKKRSQKLYNKYCPYETRKYSEKLSDKFSPSREKRK